MTGGFIRDRAGRWAELADLVGDAEARGLHRMEIGDAQRLVALYRAASGDLMMARAGAATAAVTDQLNALLSRAYVVVYRGPRLRPREVAEFVVRGFPRLVRQQAAVIMLAAALFACGGLFGAAGVALDPAGAAYLVDEQHRRLEPRERVRLDEGEAAAGGGDQARFSAFLFTHNIRVSFLAFVLGATFGIGTAVVLFMNGVMLGSLAVLYHRAGEGLFFWAWILPHGIPELTAVFIAGGAGLLLGRAMIAASPGPGARMAALRATGPGAVRLVLGLMPILVLAGVIEGTISQVHEPALPYPAKLVFGLIVGALLFAWLLRAGRAADRGAR